MAVVEKIYFSRTGLSVSLRSLVRPLTIVTVGLVCVTVNALLGF